MTPSSRKLIEVAASCAARLWARDHAIFRPIWHFVLPGGQQYVVPHPPIENKDASVAFMRELFKENSVVAYALVMEAWVMVVDHMPSPQMLREGISQHPDRREAICYQAEDQNGWCSAQQMIERGEGEPILQPLEWIEGDFSHGRLVGMLPRNGKTQH